MPRGSGRPSGAASPVPARPTIGPFEVITQLGAGGMGVVYLAKTATASLVALKVIKSELAGDAQMRERFMAEVGNLRMISSSRVARFEGADLNHDPPWLAVEYIGGPTLREHIERVGVIPAHLGPILGAVLAEGLVAIHREGVVHRDLKPHNVIMGASGPVIIDFGLARLANRGDHITETGVAVGTPAYMPPEQVHGDTDVNEKADVYALAATLVLALTGRHLYRTDNKYALVQQIIDPDREPDLSAVPGAVAEVVRPMLAHDPAARPSAAQVTAAFVEVMERFGDQAIAVRQQLTELTYVAPVLLLPSDVEDHQMSPVDHEDDGIFGPTELVAMPSPPTGAADPTAKPHTLDVAWLMADLKRHGG